MIDFRFEELPLIVENSFEAGLVNGTAEIGMCDGEPFVSDIYLDGHRQRPKDEIAALVARGHESWRVRFERKLVKLDRHTELYRAIQSQLLDGRFADSVFFALREHAAEAAE